jgi:hypothetical protein
MRTEAPWPADANVIAFDPPTAQIAAALAQRSGDRFLCATSSAQQRAKIVGAEPTLSSVVAVAPSPRAVRHNNADVLILYGASALALGYARNFRHAAWVALPVRWSPRGALAFSVAILQCLLGVLAWPCFFRAPGAPGRPLAACLAAFRVRRRRDEPRVRNYIPHRLGVRGFFERLRDAGRRYVVLRWFDLLPEVPAGEDLDLLVDDAALTPTRSLLAEGPGLQPLDLYSVSGLPGADYRGVPYFPAHLSEKILAGAAWHNGLCAVPSPRDHFLSLAYHAVYHKGVQSGLPNALAASRSTAVAEHDYAAWLQRLARQAHVEPPSTMEEVDRLLEAHGWRPPRDMLERLAQHNPWLRARLAQADKPGAAGPVLADCTKSGRRAKVEIVRHNGQLAVRKTFHAHQLRFCQRERQALAELSAVLSEVPPVLAAGDSWLIIPYYDNVLHYKRSSGKLLPLPVARQAVAALRQVYEAGYAIVDASIDNLLVDRAEGLKLFDFEFCYRYPTRPPRFEDSYDIAGCPPDFPGDQPIQGGNSYDRNWRPYIGLSLKSLLHDPPWLQHAKRAVYFAAHAHRFLPRLARHYLRAAAAAVWRAPSPGAWPAGEARGDAATPSERAA